MKVLLINGSPKTNGNTSIALDEMKKVFNEAGVETELFQIGGMNIHGCMACNKCQESGRCVIDDVVNEFAGKLKEADGMVIGSPVYYGAANGVLSAFLNRLFFSSSVSLDKTMKAGASVVIARRGGAASTFDQLNKYFLSAGMPLAPSQYWNSVHGLIPGEVLEDEEGMQTMRTLARNMIFLMQSIALGKEKYGLPEKEAVTPTNFIR